MKIRMLRDSREGNPSKGIPITTVVAAGDELPVQRVVGPNPADRFFPEGFYAVTFPDGSTRAVSVNAAEAL